MSDARTSEFSIKADVPGPNSPGRFNLTGRESVVFGLMALSFMVALALQWNDYPSVATADPVSYITGGLNLVREGQFTNPFGEPEVWFPPAYPLVIGLASIGGRLDPFEVARLASAACGLIALYLVHSFFGRPSTPKWTGALAVLVLAANSEHQINASTAMASSLATTLALAASAIWIAAPSSPRPVRYALVGFFIALSYLTRPEAVLLLPLWLVGDWCTYGFKRCVKGHLVACAVMLALMLPYVGYLHHHTGRWTISNKSDINLAQGRAQYYGEPQYYIDGDTLELRLDQPDVTLSSELSRYAYNWRQLLEAYAYIYRIPLGGGVVVAAAFGTLALYRRRDWRLLWGLLSQFAYLPIAAYYSIFPRFLHATLPALSVLAAAGIVQVFGTSGRSRNRFVAFLLVCWVALGLAESGTRYPRWALTSDTPPTAILREAGLRFSDAGLPDGVMFEWGATVGYYAGQRRGRLIVASDLATHLRYIKRHHQGPAYIALSSLERYHHSLAALRDSTTSPLPVVLKIDDSRGRVVIFRVQ